MDPTPTATRRGVSLALGVAVALILVDQATKAWVEANLVEGEFVAWLNDSIGWQLVYNDGAAFGLPLPSWVFPVVAAVVGIVILRTLPALDRRTTMVGYGMVLAGAMGNVVDRIVRVGDPGDPRWLHGHVVDFVAWGGFPRFNVADAAITVGLAVLFLDTFVGAPSTTRHEPMMMDLGGQGGASPTVRVIPAVHAPDDPGARRAVLDTVDDDLPSSSG